MLSTWFVEKEGEWFTFLRDNTGTIDWRDRSANGIAAAATVTGPIATTLITFTNSIGNIISIGDIVYVGTTTPLKVGAVISVTSNSITVDASAIGATVPVAGNMILYYKNSIAESHGARGYYMEFTMTNDNTEAVELFSVGSSIMKSYP